MPNIGPVELIIILVIALLILGPGRLPDVGSALGKSIREFRKAATDVQDSVKLDAAPAPAAPTAPAAPAPVAAAPVPNTLAAAAAPNVLVAAPADPSAAAEPEPVATSPESRA
jgi:sec-independent protein translocase protein TatA